MFKSGKSMSEKKTVKLLMHEVEIVLAELEFVSIAK